MDVIRLPWEFDHWNELKTIISTKINNISEFSKLLININPKMPIDKLIFLLTYIFEEENPIITNEYFFNNILPYIQKIILEIKERSKKNRIMPMLPQMTNIQILHRHFVSSILACVFLGIFDVYNPIICNSRYIFEKLSFIDIYEKKLIEPFKCILHYFLKIYNLELHNKYNGNIIINRIVMGENNVPMWSKLPIKFTRILATSEGDIDKSPTTDFVNFSNRLIGGDILDGKTSSNAMILSRTEALIARFCCAHMESNEAITIIGCEKFCDYSINNDFKFIDDFKDCSEVNNDGTLSTRIIFIDSTLNIYEQYQKEFFRDLNKALIGFYTKNNGKMPPIATGLWGKDSIVVSDRYVKVLQQMLASALSNRDLIYYTCGDEEFANDINDLSDFLVLGNFMIMDVINAYKLLKNRDKKLFKQLKQLLMELQQ